MSSLLLSNLLWISYSLKEGWGGPWQHSKGRRPDHIDAALNAFLTWTCIMNTVILEMASVLHTTWRRDAPRGP